LKSGRHLDAGCNPSGIEAGIRERAPVLPFHQLSA
jgi:hypothetical protein